MNQRPLRCHGSSSWFCLLASAGAIFAANAAAAPAAGNRFTMSGSATLGVDAPAQPTGRFVMRDAVALPAATDTMAVRTGGRFELVSALAPQSLACYNDTIFRDGNDGSGL